MHKEAVPITNQKEVVVKIASNASIVDREEPPLLDPPKVENPTNNSTSNGKGAG